MRSLTAAAVLLGLVLGASAGDDEFESSLRQARERGFQSLKTHKNAPQPDPFADEAAAPLPESSESARAAQRESLLSLLRDTREVQEGCACPAGAHTKLYVRKIGLLLDVWDQGRSPETPLTDAQRAEIISNYVPGGVARPQTGRGNPTGPSRLESAAVAKLIEEGNWTESDSKVLMKTADAWARWLTQDKGDAGVVAGSDDAHSAAVVVNDASSVARDDDDKPLKPVQSSRGIDAASVPLPPAPSALAPTAATPQPREVLYSGRGRFSRGGSGFATTLGRTPEGLSVTQSASTRAKLAFCRVTGSCETRFDYDPNGADPTLREYTAIPGLKAGFERIKDEAQLAVCRALRRCRTLGDTGRMARIAIRQFGGTCSIGAQRMALAARGKDVSLAALSYEAKVKGYAANIDAAGVLNGTKWDKVGALLEDRGFTVTKSYSATTAQLESSIRSTGDAIVSVDAKKLWKSYPSMTGPAPHTIYVGAMELGPRDEVLGYYINDSGTGEGARFVWKQEFDAGWDLGGGFRHLVSVQ